MTINININIFIELVDALSLGRTIGRNQIHPCVLLPLQSLHLVGSGDCGIENRDPPSLDPPIVSDVDATLRMREPFASIFCSRDPTSEV